MVIIVLGINIITRVVILVVRHFLVRGDGSFVFDIITFLINSPLAFGGGVLRGGSVGEKVLRGFDDASGSATRRFGTGGLARARVRVHGFTQWKSCR